MSAEHGWADINQPPQSPTFTGWISVRDKTNQIRYIQGRVLSSHMKCNSSGPICWWNGEKWDATTVQVIQYWYQWSFFCPDAACEVLQKPVLSWELQEQGNTCLNHFGIFQNYILNLPRLHYSLTGMFCHHHWRKNRHPVVHFDLLRILFLLFKSDDCLNCVIVPPRTISQLHEYNI